MVNDIADKYGTLDHLFVVCVSVYLVRRQWIVHEDEALATRLQDNECELYE